MSEVAQRIEEQAKAYGLSVEWEFVPLSKSRNAKENSPTLNWRYVLKKGEHEVLRGDYSQGCGHCPAYKISVASLGGVHSVARDEAVRSECETGRVWSVHSRWPSKHDIKPPHMADLIHSLVMDGSAIDSPTYEAWAGEYGYDPDSRKGEKIYRECLETGLKMRAHLGDASLENLKELCAEY